MERSRSRALIPPTRRKVMPSSLVVKRSLKEKSMITREEGITFLLVGGISALLLDLSILFLVLQGNQKRYYEQKALENEYYLQAELRYSRPGRKIRKLSADSAMI